MISPHWSECVKLIHRPSNISQFGRKIHPNIAWQVVRVKTDEQYKSKYRTLNDKVPHECKRRRRYVIQVRGPQHKLPPSSLFAHSQRASHYHQMPRATEAGPAEKETSRIHRNYL